jgi:hypothetical protein
MLKNKRINAMPKENLDLAGIFNTVTQMLASNQQALNQADTYNQDHGDNMVQTFQTITGALKQKQGVSASKALSYAAKELSKSTSSQSGQLYAQNLVRASTQFKGKSIDTMGALSLLQTLIGGGQVNQPTSQSAVSDILGSLLGNLTGGGQTPQQQTPQSSGGDLLGMLMGSLAGGTGLSTQASNQSSGGDLLGSLLGGLLGGSGGSLENLVQAFLGGSGMGDASHRTQSTQLVVNAFLQALTSMKK